MRPSARWSSMLVALVALLGARTASAASPGPSREACLAAAERGQELRNAGKLQSARAELLVCQAASCPGLVRQDCIRWYGEVAEAVPSVIVSVKDDAGDDLVDATITIDGQAVPRESLGRPVPVDPGAHTVRAVRGDLQREIQVIVAEGVKQRAVEIVLAPPQKAAPIAAPTAPVSPPRVVLVPSEPVERSLLGPQRYVAIAIAGAGAFAVVTGAAIGAGYNSDVSSLRAGCGRTTSCTQAEVDAIAGQKTAAYVLAGLGGALVVSGVVLFVTGAPPRREKPSLSAGVVPIGGGAFASLGGSF